MRNFYIKLMFLVIVMMLVAVSLMTYRNLNNYITEVNLIRHSSDVFRSIDQTLLAIKDAEIGQRGFQLTHDTLSLEPYYAALNSLPDKIKMLDSLLKENVTQSRKVDTLEYLINVQFSTIDKILTLEAANSESVNEINSLWSEEQKNMLAIKRILLRMSAEETKIFNERLSSETDFRNIAPLALLLYTLIALAGVSLLFSKVLDALDKQRIAEGQLTENIVALKSEVGMREFTQKTLRSVLDNSLDGIMAFRSVRNKQREIEDFEWTLANAIGSTYAGRVEHELIGNKLLEVLPEVKEQGLFDVYKEVVLTGHPRQFEKYYVHGPNNAQWYNITVVKFEDGFIVTFSNISHQKKQRLIIEERGVLLNEAEALANMGSWKWDEANQTLLWSNGLYKILNKREGSFLPQRASFLENVHVDDYPSVEANFEKVFVARQEITFEYRIQLNGTFKYLSLTSKPLMDPNPLDILGTVIDITKQKTYEAQLKDYTGELQRSNEDLEQFAYVASHDLQEPLRKIRAFGDRLSNRYKGQLDGPGEDYIQRMQSAATRMQTLIEDLLSFSRVSRSSETFQPLEMNQIMAEVLEDLDIQIKKERAVVTVGKLPGITGERMQIKRLFQNLINNAVKFHKPGQNPTIEVRGTIVKRKDIRSELGLNAADTLHARFSVKDDGIGFEEKYNEKIFNIFQRLHGRAEYEGTGIGLAICRKITANHKGYIAARGMENIGSEFIVILPLS
jgi:signal transduction histidine kinase/CHASE3 domain sensor protein